MLESSLEIGLRVVIRRKCKTRPPFPFGIKTDEIFGHILGGAFGARLGFFPFSAAETRKLHQSVVCVCADILCNTLQSVTGQEQPVASRILYADIIHGDPVNGERFQPQIAANPVRLMHHQITRVQIGIRKDGSLGVLLLPPVTLFCQRKAAPRLRRAKRQHSHAGGRQFKAGQLFPTGQQNRTGSKTDFLKKG